MKTNITIESVNFEKWDDLLVGNPLATFFHTSSWIKVLSETYGYMPLFIILKNGEQSTAVMPLMEIKSPITGNRGVSLPFSDFCEPLLNSSVLMDEVIVFLKVYGREKGWKYFEMRGGNKVVAPASVSYGRHSLDLSQGIKQITSVFQGKTLRNIKTAEKKKVEVAIGDSMEMLCKFIRLNYMTRKSHGLPPQPDRFFHKIHEHVLSQGKGITVLAFYNGVAVAGAVYFHFGDQALYKYSASDRTYQQLCANNAVMWEAIKWYTARGYKNICFGRTDLKNEGLRAYKTGWGAKEYIVDYYKYDIQKGSFITESPQKAGFYNKLIMNMPLPLLRIAGSLLYRHVA